MPISPPEDLRLAIVGLPRSGKTTLLTHLTTAWPSPITPSPPPPQPPSRLSAFPLTPFFSSLFRSLGRLNTPFEAQSHLICNSGQIWDADGAATGAVANATESKVDVILYVTRLDHGRICREDLLAFSDIALHFGWRGLEQTIIVLTRGWATGLPFKEYVRGRRDLLWRLIAEMLPPIKPEDVGVDVGNEEGDDEREIDGGETGQGEGENGGDVVEEGEEEGIDEETEGSETAEQNEAVDETGGAEGWEQQREREQADLQRRLDEALDNDSEDRGSESGIPENAIDLLYENLEEELKNQRYIETPRPPVLAVELSESCPRNEEGRKILPDGTDWLEELQREICAKTEQSRSWHVESEEVDRTGFIGRIREMVGSLLKDGIRLVLAEVAVGVLALQVGKVIKGIQKKRKEAESEDLVLEVSDEEWEKLNKDEGPVIWRYDEDGNRVSVDTERDELEKELLEPIDEEEEQAKGEEKEESQNERQRETKADDES